LKGLTARALANTGGAAPAEAASAARDVSDQAIEASTKVGEALGVLKSIARRDPNIS
jgi:hypothetical protein